jgi:N-dimethylarginine dimethylaminohydrolase
MHKINTKVLMSGVDYFAVEELNPYSFVNNQPSREAAKEEYLSLQDTFQNAGIEIIKTPAPENCQDGVYTANWALCLGGLAIMANLPKMRSQESPYAEKALKNLGYDIKRLPEDIRFSGQGDALVCCNIFLPAMATEQICPLMSILNSHLPKKLLACKLSQH